MIHCAWSRLRPKAVIIGGRATFIVAPLTTTMKPLSITVAASHHLYEALSGVIARPLRHLAQAPCAGGAAWAGVRAGKRWDPSLRGRDATRDSPRYRGFQHSASTFKGVWFACRFCELRAPRTMSGSGQAHRRSARDEAAPHAPERPLDHPSVSVLVLGRISIDV